jgi:hypothetical protein
MTVPFRYLETVRVVRMDVLQPELLPFVIR